MMLKFGRIAVVSAAVLALAAATIPSRAEADGYFPRGYGPVGNGYGSGGYYGRRGRLRLPSLCPASSAALLPGLCSAALLWLRRRQ